jgi:GrpB-like predicted nucleotidyltransferase (UPF0157 family)
MHASQKRRFFSVSSPPYKPDNPAMPEDPYVIIPYSSEWPAEFRLIAARIRAALGPLAIRIDHIGSTSVPDLCAKDVIDTQITVANLDDPAIVQGLAASGFELRPKVVQDHIPPGDPAPPEAWRKLFFREAPGRRRTNVHARLDGRPNQRYALLFRDYLRSHPAAAAAYAQIKERLAPKLERLDYIDAKDPVCDLIIQAAEVWAKTGWQPGPSDA